MSFRPQTKHIIVDSMPQRKRQSKKSKSTRKGTRALVPRPILPLKQTVTMAYSQTSTLTEAAAGAGVIQTFALNNLFDPNFTGVGTQPIGYDQLSNIYGRFRVLRVGIRVTLMGLTTNAYCGIYPSSQSTLPASFQAYADQPMGKSTLLQSGGPTKTFSMNVQLWNVLGVKKNEYLLDQDFSHLSTSGPARTAYLQLWLQGLGGVTASIAAESRLVYEVEVSAPFALNVS